MTHLHYYINITMESVALLMVVILLISCISRKDKTATRKALVMWCVNLIALLSVQIFLWGTGIVDLEVEHTTFFRVVYRVLFVMDFTLYYCVSLSHINYVSAFLYQIGAVSPETGRFLSRCRMAVYVWGVVSVALFASSMWTGWFYSIAPNGSTIYKSNYAYMAAVSAIVPCTAPILAMVYSRQLGKRNTILLQFYFFMPLFVLWADIAYDLCLSYVLYAFAVLGIYISVEIAQGMELDQKKAELAKMESDMTNLRVSMMLTQIQPHFIFNILGSIEQLCRLDPKKAGEATNFFAKYLRNNLESVGNTNLVPFSDELNHVHNYIWLEQIRFDEDLVYEENIENVDFRIPPLTIQPLVENSIKHGMRHLKSGALVVKLKTAAYRGGVEVTITDNGGGFDPTKPLYGKHVGLQNVRDRLKATTGGTMEISSTEGAGTTIVIRVPDPAN